MLTDDEIRAIYLRGFDDHREGDEAPFFGHFLDGFRACEAATLASSSAAREDAERYRWLRDAPATSAPCPMREWLWRRPFGTGGKLDAMIDAARSATKGEGAG